ncbi:DUF3667 domain-containing protein [uncultured Paraglaciecola sp.]|uniref:DUF3667 domain-containing protein n=1 Tax=uncultured Paraglaciecola sp. TaxID=1765024 RepID=UPI0030DD787E
MSEYRCQNCHQPMIGKFCYQCGEQKFDKQHRRITILFSDLFESLYSIDNRFLKSTIVFFSKPGFLAHEFCRGVRVPYVKPISFFLIINLLYFIVSPMTDFSLPLKSQALQPYAALVNEVVEKYLVVNDVSFEELAARYDPLSQTLAKSLVILSVPLLLPFVWLANPSRRFYLIDHAVNALYTYAFVLLWPMIIICFLEILELFDLNVSNRQGFLPALLIPYYFYIVLSQRNQYQDGWWMSSVKATVIFVGIIVSHFVYRFLQFGIVWWQIT